FGKQGKLNPRYIGPFKILKRIGPVAYKIELPEELSNVHIAFYISNLKKCLSDESLVILKKELRLNDKLKFVEEPAEVMDREVKQLKQSRIPIIKVRWNSKRGPEFTWEREDQIRANFVRHYAIISKPLTKLLKKNAFEWDEVAQMAFIELKQAMTQAPVLALSDFQKTFVVETNASSIGIGAVLQQEGHLIAYLSVHVCSYKACNGSIVAECKVIVKEKEEVMVKVARQGSPFNGGNFRRCTNVSFGDEFVHNPDPISIDETPDFFYPPSQPQTSSFDKFYCYGCRDLLEEGFRCQQCTCKRHGSGLSKGFCYSCASSNENSSIEPYSFNDTSNVFTHPPQPQYETYLYELCGNDSHYGYDCPPRFPLVYEQEPSYNQNYDDNYYPHNSPSFLCCDNYGVTHTFEPSRRLNSFCYDDDDDDEESTIPLSDIISQLPPSNVMTTSPPILPIKDPEVSLIMGNEELNTIPKKESNEFIKSSVEDLVSIPRKSRDPLFNSNDDFTSSDDESLSDEDVLEENFKIYLNPLFEFDDEYISSDVNPLFDEVLDNIECKDSYYSNLDESTFLVTPIFDSNKDEYFTPGDDVELLLHCDPSTPIMSVVSILKGFTDEPPFEENGDLFDLESKENECKKILYDAPINDLMTEEKVFDLGIPKNFFSNINFEDSRARGFVHRPLELLSLAYGNPIS
nr:putative reverse transcriptase domain-containing protein [Tanacetum cinerariifolium]